MDNFMNMNISNNMYSSENIGLGHVIESKAKINSEKEEAEVDKLVLANSSTFVFEKNETVENQGIIIQQSQTFEIKQKIIRKPTYPKKLQKPSGRVGRKGRNGRVPRLMTLEEKENGPKEASESE